MVNEKTDRSAALQFKQDVRTLVKVDVWLWWLIAVYYVCYGLLVVLLTNTGLLQELIDSWTNWYMELIFGAAMVNSAEYQAFMPSDIMGAGYSFFALCTNVVLAIVCVRIGSKINREYAECEYNPYTLYDRYDGNVGQIILRAILCTWALIPYLILMKRIKSGEVHYG